MALKYLFKKPFSEIRNIKNRTAKISYTNVSDYMMGGIGLGTIGGSITGMVSSLGIPLYVGWQIGEYVSDKLSLPGVIEFPVDVVSSIAFTGFAAPIAFPILAVTGGIGGAVIGGIVGTTVGIGKKGLEKIL